MAKFNFFSQENMGNIPEEVILEELIKANKNMKKKIGIYPGSFNPFTTGHLNILQKAERILGEGNVIVAIGYNPTKTLTDTVERANNLSQKLKREVISYNVFLHELILQKEEEGYDVVLIRGLRNGDDLAYEDNQLKFMKELLPEDYELDTMFLMCDDEYKHISSSAVRALETFREGSGDKYII